ncbi:MAG: NAD(+)/NADH kinase [Desulfobacteraceae bacterium]|nr:NAD(+)/NADH kinase [Desulfobacteraceae bacterium]
MKKIGLVIKNDTEAQKRAEEIKTRLGEQCVVIDVNGPNKSKIPGDLFSIVVLGGDGTFLSVARFIGNKDIPLMGIKFGEVGFLAETLEDKLFHALDALLNGEFTIGTRERLTVTVKRDDKIKTSVDVLNDAVINKSALSRLASCAVYIDSKYITTYRADGLIVATPTGSTAYSLAAGGPVIHPDVPGIILTPICPFTLTNRPLIIPDSASVEIRLEGNPSDILLTFDGQEGVKIDSMDRIYLKKSENPIKMISLNDQNYFNVLKARLMWSGGKG